MLTLQNHIAGQETAPLSEAWLTVTEPATGQIYAKAPASDARDIEAAVRAASDAWPAWSSHPPSHRAQLLESLADLIDRDTDRLAEAESIDTGKPITLARSVDIPRAASNFRFFARAIQQAESQVHQTDDHTLNLTLRKSRGVAGLISPWNLPLYLLTWKIAPALATGNTCVAKPSEVTPRTAALLAELLPEAGFPPGVVNVVHGTGDQAGAALVTHPEVPTISFTGSTRVGQWIAQHAGHQLKRVSLELGGKNPNIVFADVDLEQAVDAALRAAFTNQGQICHCGSRILVERSIFAPFVQALVERAQALRIGDPGESTTQFGALTSREHLEKVEQSVEQARADGADVLCGGQRSSVNGRCAMGYFYEPTLLVNAAPTSAIEQTEIFGPVASITPFDSEGEAQALANATSYGLAAMIWTRDLDRAHRLAARLDAGIVWVNCWMLRDLRTPFGGMKQSGVGREGGNEALRFFTEPRNVCIRIGDSSGSS